MRSAGVCTGYRRADGKLVGYSSLTPHVRMIMNNNFIEIRDLLRTGAYSSVVYSSTDPTTGDLGTGLFDVHPEVKSYFVKQLRFWVENYNVVDAVFEPGAYTSVSTREKVNFLRAGQGTSSSSRVLLEVGFGNKGMPETPERWFSLVSLTMSPDPSTDPDILCDFDEWNWSEDLEGIFFSGVFIALRHDVIDEMTEYSLSERREAKESEAREVASLVKTLAKSGPPCKWCILDTSAGTTPRAVREIFESLKIIGGVDSVVSGWCQWGS